MSQDQWKDLLNELAIIEAKYWRYLRGTRLQDHYVLVEDEGQQLNFRFIDNTDLAQHIKEECYAIFKKYQLEQYYQNKRQA